MTHPSPTIRIGLARLLSSAALTMSLIVGSGKSYHKIT